jgi:hypothetical protein
MGNNLEGSGRGLIEVLYSIYVAGLRKATKKLSQDRRTSPVNKPEALLVDEPAQSFTVKAGNNYSALRGLTDCV